MSVYKIVWLCTFSNEAKRAQLALWRKRQGGEIGQWIPNLLKGFIGDSRFEIHVVSSEPWMRKGRQSWCENTIHYHCFQPAIPGLGYAFRMPFEALTAYRFNRWHLSKIIADIQPDLIHLFGVENASYASAILDVDPQIPVLALIQGFVHRNPERDFNARARCAYEAQLLRHIHHYIGDYDSEQVVRAFNPDVTWRHFYLPVNEELVAQTQHGVKNYDLVFAGALTQAKGFPDFLELVRRVKNEFPHLRAGVVGKKESYAPAAEFVMRHGLTETIDWLGRFPTQKELFQVYRQTRVFVTPTYNDAFASTIRECMLLGTPVVSYKTGGIPYANRDGQENVVIVEQGDLDGLYQQVIDLLRNASRRNAQAARAQRFAENEFSLHANVEVIKSRYRELLTGRP